MGWSALGGCCGRGRRARESEELHGTLGRRTDQRPDGRMPGDVLAKHDALVASLQRTASCSKTQHPLRLQELPSPPIEDLPGRTRRRSATPNDYGIIGRASLRRRKSKCEW